MIPILKLLRLSTTDKALLFRAWLVSAVIRLGLCLMPFQTLRTLLIARISFSGRRPTRDRDEDLVIDRVSWAVRVASRYIPTPSSCIIRALTTQVLLAGLGLPAHLHVGVHQSSEGQLQGHAWLECHGRIVMGRGGHERYVPLTISPKREVL